MWMKTAMSPALTTLVVMLSLLSVTSSNSNNSTASHLAAGKHDFEVAKRLHWFRALDNNTDLDTTNQEGWSAFDVSSETNNLNVKDVFQSKGAENIKHNSTRYEKRSTPPSTTKAPTTNTRPRKVTSFRNDKRSTTPSILDEPTTIQLPQPTTITRPRKVTSFRNDKRSTTPSTELDAPTTIQLPQPTTITRPRKVTRHEKRSTNPIATTTKTPTISTRPPKATRRPDLKRLTGREMKIHEATKQAMDIQIASLCAEGVDPNVADIQNNGYTPSHIAAAHNGKLALIALARCSANLNAKDFDGNTPLHIAVIKDYPWAFDILQMLGANPNIPNNEGKLPKDLLVMGKNSNFENSFDLETMKWFRDIRALSDREEELLSFVKSGHYMTVARACMEGVDVRVKDVNHNQYTLLHHAVSIKANVPLTIQMLIRCGADINARDADGNTPLHLAVREISQEPQNTLLLNGADPFIANREGKTAYEVIKISSPDNIDSRLQWYMMNSMPL